MRPDNFYDIIKDEEGVSKIQDFVRTNPDIEVYDYIKRGLNGEVYFGKRKKLGDEVVLKFYWASPAFDSSEEAVILRKIDHPNILKVYDLRFLPPNYAYFITPKISGGDLQEKIERENIDTKTALKTVADILMGVNELHSNHQLVHRDLKPGNILINLSTSSAIIADLGAVKHIATANGHVTASKSTRVYLPPEAILRNEYYYQSDIYQVGIILFQLLGGFFPVSDEIKWLTAKEQAIVNGTTSNTSRLFKFDELIDQKICKGKIADTATIPFYLNTQFKTVLNRALNLNPAKRFTSAAEFLKAIHSLLRGCPTYGTIGEHLHIIHDNGKEYRIWKSPNKEYLLEKKITCGWRKNNEHDGTKDSVLAAARKK
jgi:serine/threonine protein kinase